MHKHWKSYLVKCTIPIKEIINNTQWKYKRYWYSTYFIVSYSITDSETLKHWNYCFTLKCINITKHYKRCKTGGWHNFTTAFIAIYWHWNLTFNCLITTSYQTFFTKSEVCVAAHYPDTVVAWHSRPCEFKLSILTAYSTLISSSHLPRTEVCTTFPLDVILLRRKLFSFVILTSNLLISKPVHELHMTCFISFFIISCLAQSC